MRAGRAHLRLTLEANLRLAATEGRTRLLITHRPVAAAEVDQIIRLGRPRQPETTAWALVPTGPLAAAL
jgi:ABC-type transport system involved in cytochrome bd biosynthesis fused ATPase/permease subunit